MNPIRIYIALIIYFSLFGMQNVYTQTSNLLTIGDMESGGWTIKNLDSNATLNFVANEGVGSSKGMVVQATNIGLNSYYVILGSSKQITLSKDEFYTVSYWAKTSDTPGIGLIPWIQIGDASIDYPFLNLQTGYLTSSWTKYTYTFANTLPTSSKVIFKFRVWSPGTIYIDNVKIGPASADEIHDAYHEDLTPIYDVQYVQDGVNRTTLVYKSNCPIYIPGYMDMQSKDEIPLSLFKGRSISWTNFSFDGSIEVKVKVLNTDKVPIQGKDIRILPSRYNIIPTVNGDEVSFTLTTPGQFSVEIGEEGYKNGLMIFANPLETDIPDINDSEYLVLDPSNDILNPSDIPLKYKGIYFKKGEHNIDVFDIPAHVKNIYLADSAWVYGAFLGEKGNGIKIFGRGIISQDRMNYRRAHGIDIATDSATVEGVVVADFKRFAVRLRGSYNRIDWVKVIGGWVYNCDGITAYANSTVSHCFIWANDDAIKVYLSNITWSDIVVWQLNNGGVIQISWGRTLADNCRISRVDVLRADWVKAGFNAALFSCVGNYYNEPDRYSMQSNWVIEDLVTENPVPIIFGLNPDPHSINHIRNFTLKNWNVKMEEGAIFRNRIKNGNPQTIIDGFVFDNFIYNDVLLTKDNWVDVMQIDTSGFGEPTFYPIVNNIVTPSFKHKFIPNPVSDILNVYDTTSNDVLKVYDMNAHLFIIDSGNTINVASLNRGMYLLTVNDVYQGTFIKN